MISLPNRVVDAPEEQQNFEYLESIISQNRFGDVVLGTAVIGPSEKKLEVLDTAGNLIGYVPVYPN